jgi:hypothetical protein
MWCGMLGERFVPTTSYRYFPQVALNPTSERWSIDREATEATDPIHQKLNQIWLLKSQCSTTTKVYQRIKGAKANQTTRTGEQLPAEKY